MIWILFIVSAVALVTAMLALAAVEQLRWIVLDTMKACEAQFRRIDALEKRAPYKHPTDSGLYDRIAATPVSMPTSPRPSGERE